VYFLRFIKFKKVRKKGEINMKKILITSLLFMSSLLSTTLFAATCPPINQTYLDETTNTCVVPEGWSLEPDQQCLSKAKTDWSWFAQAQYVIDYQKIFCFYRGFGGQFILSRVLQSSSPDEGFWWLKVPKNAWWESAYPHDRLICYLGINDCVFP
jgi:hypothetical protein